MNCAHDVLSFFKCFDNFDQIYLAQKVEKHELLEFRRIASYLYKRNKRWVQSVQLSKEDRMYKDAIDTAAESGDVDIAEDLLRFFVSVADRASFSATLYTCYDLIRPDVVLELAWRNGYTDFAMPFIIQYTRHLHERVHTLETRTAPPKEDPHVDNSAALGLGLGGPGLLSDTLMITNGPAYGAYPGGYGAPAGYGAPGSIPDPYAQPPAYGGGYGLPPQPGYGGGYY